MKPIAKRVKQSALVLILACFAGVMVWLALDKEYDKVVALAGVLVAIVSAPIFSVRADMEKHLFTLQTEKRYEVYRKLAATLQNWLGNLYALPIDPRPEMQIKHKDNFENGFNTFSAFYAEYSLFFSDDLCKRLHDISVLAANIDLPFNPQTARMKGFVSKVDQIEKLHREVKKLLKEEIGL